MTANFSLEIMEARNKWKRFFFLSVQKKPKTVNPEFQSMNYVMIMPKIQKFFLTKFNIPSLKKKPLSKVGIEENFLNLMKRIYQKIPAANIILNGEILDAFLLKLGTRQG